MSQGMQWNRWVWCCASESKQPIRIAWVGVRINRLGVPFFCNVCLFDLPQNWPEPCSLSLSWSTRGNHLYWRTSWSLVFRATLSNYLVFRLLAKGFFFVGGAKIGPPSDFDNLGEVVGRWTGYFVRRTRRRCCWRLGPLSILGDVWDASRFERRLLSRFLFLVFRWEMPFFVRESESLEEIAAGFGLV